MKTYTLNNKFQNKNIIKIIHDLKDKDGTYALRIVNNTFTASKLNCDGLCAINSCNKKLSSSCSLSDKYIDEFKIKIKNDIIDELLTLNVDNVDIKEISNRLNSAVLLRSKWIIGLSYDEVIKTKAKQLEETFYKNVSKVNITKDDNNKKIITITKERIKQTDKLDILYPSISDRLFSPKYIESTMYDKNYNILFSYKIDDNHITSFIKDNLLDIYAWTLSLILNSGKSIVGLKPSVLMKERTHQVVVRCKKPDNEVILPLE